MITIRNAEPTDYEMVKMLEDSIFLIYQQARPDYFNSQAWYTKEEFEELLMFHSPIWLVATGNRRESRDSGTLRLEF